MAFKAQASKEASVIDLYCGVTTFKVLAVNPNLAGMKKLFPNYKKEEEPTYVGKDQDGNNQCRVTFYCQTIADSCNGIDTIFPISFFLVAKAMESQKGAFKIIDKYGRTAWATKEQIEKHEIPQYTNGPANISADYRKAYTGEEELISFLKALLNIKNVDKWENGKVVGLIDDPSEAECSIENMKAIISGNVKELKDVLEMFPENKAKCVLGVKSTDKGNNQIVFMDTTGFMKLANNKYDRVNATIKARIANGGLKNQDFTGDGNRSPISLIKKWEPSATVFIADAESNPLGAPATDYDDI